MINYILKKGFVIGIIFLFLVGSFAAGIKLEYVNQPTILGNTLYVGGSEPGNYTKIQDAIENATNGDTVFVYNESSPYYENVVVNKSINLIGQDKNTTIIDAKKNGDIVSITANEVNISGFNITNGVDGIFLDNCINVIIKGNIIQYCQDGIDLFFSNYNIIKENIVKNNNGLLSKFKVGGIDLNSSNHNNISHNIIQDNLGVAILSFRSNNNIIYSNSFENNTVSGVYIEEYSNDNQIIKNNFFDSKKYDGFFWNFSNQNKWDSNYWDKWIGHKFPLFNKFPKLIRGWWAWFLPCVKFDWHPAKEPYDIVV